MILATTDKPSVFSEEQINHINIDSVLPALTSLQEDRLNFMATFRAENGAELEFEFHCSDSAEALGHIECLANYLKKDIHFLKISGDKWNSAPDRLKRVFVKRKLELKNRELEIIDSSMDRSPRRLHTQKIEIKEQV